MDGSSYVQVDMVADLLWNCLAPAPGIGDLFAKWSAVIPLTVHHLLTDVMTSACGRLLFLWSSNKMSSSCEGHNENYTKAAVLFVRHLHSIAVQVAW